MLLSSSDTKRTLMHLFLFTNSTQRESWFQYVRRVYATAITSLALHSCLYPHLRLHVLGCIVSRVLIYSVLMKKETIAKNCKPHWLEYKLNQPLFFSKKKHLFYLRLTDRNQIEVILYVS